MNAVLHLRNQLLCGMHGTMVLGIKKDSRHIATHSARVITVIQYYQCIIYARVSGVRVS
jgi:hypothetical protein